jgi:hypothetical protein
LPNQERVFIPAAPDRSNTVDVDTALFRMARLLEPSGSLLLVEMTPFAWALLLTRAAGSAPTTVRGAPPE